jgi:hypothetical protein
MLSAPARAVATCAATQTNTERVAARRRDVRTRDRRSIIR